MLTHLFSEYGYLAILIGTIAEGESVLLLGGFSAHQGYLSFPLVVLVALCGGALGDCTLFFLGRRYGPKLLKRYPKWQPGVDRITLLLQRHPSSTIIGVRFMYGLRTVGPLAIGMSAVSAWHFVWLNVLGAFLWASLISGIGYVFGRGVTLFFDDVKYYEELLLIVLLAAAAAWAVLHWYRRTRHASRRQPSAGQ